MKAKGQVAPEFPGILKRLFALSSPELYIACEFAGLIGPGEKIEENTWVYPLFPRLDVHLSHLHTCICVSIAI
jgi:hypothetical protein